VALSQLVSATSTEAATVVRDAAGRAERRLLRLDFLSASSTEGSLADSATAGDERFAWGLARDALLVLWLRGLDVSRSQAAQVLHPCDDFADTQRNLLELVLDDKGRHIAELVVGRTHRDLAAVRTSLGDLESEEDDLASTETSSWRLLRVDLRTAPRNDKIFPLLKGAAIENIGWH